MRWALLSVLALLALGATLALATEQNPQQFLDVIYAPYAVDAKPLGRDKVYSNTMLQLMERDQELADGEVGYLNGDPLCDCQDYMPFKPTYQVSESDTAVIAHVAFKNGSSPKKLTLHLIKEASAWRVNDVADDKGSLQQKLRSYIAEQEKMAH